MHESTGELQLAPRPSVRGPSVDSGVRARVGTYLGVQAEGGYAVTFKAAGINRVREGCASSGHSACERTCFDIVTFVLNIKPEGCPAPRVY